MMVAIDTVTDLVVEGPGKAPIPEIGIEKTVTGLAAGKKAGLKSS
ncbi:MAG: hypothetical protein WBJ32_01305 [Bacillota bacterium]|jgi:hypothetical protein|nr:hypothetical protein [Bacillota bacterium]